MTKPISNKKIKHTIVSSIDEANSVVAEEYSAMLKTKQLAVNIHYRKIKRIRKTFNALKDYYIDDNPFLA